MALPFESALQQSRQRIPSMIQAGEGASSMCRLARRAGGVQAGMAFSLSRATMIGLTVSIVLELGTGGKTTDARAWPLPAQT